MRKLGRAFELAVPYAPQGLVLFLNLRPMQRILAGAAALLILSSASAGAQNQQRSAHQRMRDLLAEIDEREPFGTQYVLAVNRQRQRVRDLPHQVGLMQQTAMIQRLAEAELRAARPAAAFEHLDEVARTVALLTASKRLRLTLMSRFWTGAFFLRQAMIGNCRGAEASARCTLPIREGEAYPEQDALRDAIENLTAVVNLTQPEAPEHMAGQWLLNVAYMLGGSYPEGVPRQHRIDPRYLAGPAPTIPPFEDVSADMGVDTVSTGGGVAADDFDGDGWIDMLLSSADLSDNVQYLRNNGDGSFEDITFAAGLEGITGGVSLTHADYDNDGDLDVFIVRGGWLGELGRHPNSLLRNNGDSTFTDVTLDVGLGDEHYPSAAAAWADYDGDGDLDLYVANDSTGENGWHSQLFRNRGDGTFEEVGGAAGVGSPGQAVGAAWGDYDDDGDPDLYVSYFRGPNRLYRNDGGVFTDVAKELGVADPRHSYTVWFWDVDNDDDLDLLVSSYRTPQTAIPDLWYYAASLLGRNQLGDTPRLYLNDGEGGFLDATESYGLARVTLATGANFGDLDNDGFLDFYVATGYPGIEAVIPNLMYKNRAGRGFQDITWAGGFGHLQNGQAVVFADYDNDGDQDVYTRMGGLLPRDRFRDAFYRNPGFGRNWLAVELRGQRSNRFGVGAVVRAQFRDGGIDRTLHRVVGRTGSYGANPHRLHLGLGAAERLERLEVFWPATGERQVFRSVAVNQRILITEGSDTFATLQRAPAKATH